MSDTKMQQKLERAAKDGNFDELVLLIGLTNPKNNDSSALGFAACNGHTRCVKLLIPLSDPKATNSLALQDAARRGKTDCVKLLIPVSDPEADDNLALRSAARHGHADCVKLLLDVLVNKDQPMDFASALGDAAREGKLECVRHLMGVCTSEDANALFVGTINRGRLECAQELATLGISSENYTNALEIACRNEDLPMVEWLFPQADTSKILQYAHDYFSFMEHAPPLIEYLEQKIAEQQRSILLSEVKCGESVKKRRM